MPEAKGDRPAQRDPVRLALLAGSIGCLLLVGLAHPSVAAPPLGPAGWVPHLPDLPLRGWGVVAVQTLGYLLGGIALLRTLWRPSSLRTPWWVWPVLGGLVLLTVPYGTADHTNYAAYGRILLEGGDPWLTSPAGFGEDPVTSMVRPPWQDTPSVYGPVATGLMGVAAAIGGESMRAVVWVWQVILVLAWLAARWVLVALTGRREVVDTWWSANPLVLGAGLFGAHVDLLATAFVVGALAVGVRARGVGGSAAAGVLVGLAASSKITAGVVGLALALPHLRRCLPKWRGSASWVAATQLSAMVVAALAVMVPLHLWAGPHVFGQLLTATGGISYASPWRAVYTLLDVVAAEPLARQAASLASWVLVLALAAALWRLLLTPFALVGLAEGDRSSEVPRGAADVGGDRSSEVPRGSAVAGVLLVLTAAYALGAAYVLPWYELPMWAAAAAWLGLTAGEGGARSRVARLALTALVVRGTVLALGYVPGRVELPGDIETVTLGFRFVVVPLTTAVVWLVILRWARSRSVPARRGPGAG